MASKQEDDDAGSMTSDDRKMELLDKLKAASKAPEQAAQKIRALDSMIKKLKSNRHKCQVAIDEDEEQLKWIAREEESIHVRLDPLAARLKEREETAARVRKQIEDAVNLFNGILGTTNDRITKTRMKAANHRKAEASEELRAARGFSAAAAESPHRTRPKGYFKGTRKK